MAAGPTGGPDDVLAPSEQAAFAACGGGAIENWHRVQPTPERDKCLAEQQHIQSPSNSDETTGNMPRTATSRGEMGKGYIAKGER